jgi:SpoVK/Ycf46/Vps4 family AAA+-type ATPase
MLPKLANIRKRGTLVFIIATNNIGEFDLAIRRLGRFDRIVQIMPPTFAAKMKKKDWNLEGKLGELGVSVKGDVEQKIGDLAKHI